MKRLSLYIFVVLVSASLLLSACGGSAATPAATGASQPAAATPIKVRVASDATFPPFESVDETTKNIVGFDIDLLNAIGQKEGLQLEYINVAFDPLLAGMAQCQYDMAASAMTITDERKKSMLFSDPYFAAGQIVSVQANNNDITGKDSLKGKKVGAQIGTTGAIEVQKIDGAELKTYDDIGLAYQDLINGQLDAVVVDDGLARAYVSKNKDKLKIVGQPFTDEAYGFAICKNKPDLQQKVNDGLKAVKAEGLIDQLNQKWLVGGGK